MPTTTDQAKDFLLAHPAIFGWDKIKVGPDFTIEYRSTHSGHLWEVQRNGGHAGLHRHLDDALAAVLDQDDSIDLERDVSELPTPPAPAPAQPVYYSRTFACFICDKAPGEQHMRQVKHKRHRIIVVCDKCCDELIAGGALLPWED